MVELKACSLTFTVPSDEGFNRSMVELKGGLTGLVFFEADGFNRSMVELKVFYRVLCMAGFNGFNRSMVELKVVLIAIPKDREAAIQSIYGRIESPCSGHNEVRS